jgi:hypothetical protein
VRRVAGRAALQSERSSSHEGKNADHQGDSLFEDQVDEQHEPLPRAEVQASSSCSTTVLWIAIFVGCRSLRTGNPWTCLKARARRALRMFTTMFLRQKKTINSAADDKY